MSRFTRRNNDDIYVTGGLIEYGYWKEQPLYKAFEKLAHYEDLEEQGRLIESPITIGKPYYEIIANGNVAMFPLRPASAGRIVQYGLFGRTVFATRKEAEAKLAELGGKA